MKENINPKSYVFVKFLFTFSIFFLSLVGFISLITAIMIRDENNQNWIVINFYTLTIILTVFASLFAIAFIILRLLMYKKSEYKYQSKEKKILIVWYLLYVSCFICTIFLIISKLFHIQTFFIISIIYIALLFILGIILSVLEAIIRNGEQILIAKKWFSQDQDINDDPTLQAEEDLKKQETTIKNQTNNKKNPFMEE